MTRFLIIGAGSMGHALCSGLAGKSLTDIEISIFDIHPSKYESLPNNVKTLDNLDHKELKYEAVFLCIKPQELLKIGKELEGKLATNTTIVSILAGITLSDLERDLNFKGPLIRAMPNIAATCGEAATAMCSNILCDEKHKQYAELVFNAVGSAWWTKESLLDAVTGLSGSGPAYIYMIIESLSDGGVKMGIPRDLATNLAIQTVLGSAQHVKSTGSHPAVLKEQVTTPGGTTINAIHELEAHGLRSMLISAVETATLQSAKLRSST